MRIFSVVWPIRVEHPQALIDRGQYRNPYAEMVLRGKGLLPVADYKLTAQVIIIM